jgi:hypothetical protein
MIEQHEPFKNRVWTQMLWSELASQDGGWWNFVVVKTFKLTIFYRLTSFENGYVLYMDPQPRVAPNLMPNISTDWML